LREEQVQVLEDQLNVKEEKVKEEKPTKAKVPVRESSKEVRETKDEKIDAREEKDDGIIGALKLVAPGTRLREGLDSILRAKTGALIVLGDSAEVLEVVEGGFHLDAEFAPPI
jgi:diadenylate cyclase